MSKKIVAMLMAVAMAFSLLPVTAFATGGTNDTAGATSVTADTEDGVHISKKVEKAADGNYNLVMEAYVEGTTEITTSTEPLDIVLVLDVSGSMDDPMGNRDNTKRIDALKSAVNAFIENVAEKNTSTDGTAVDHKISIVKFAGDKTDKVGDDTYKKYGYTYNYSQIVKNLTTVDATGKEDLKTAVNGLRPAGATRADYGMELAQTELNSNLTDQSRDKVVVMFTDGTPTSENSFESSVASGAISASKDLKEKNVKVYTIGIFDDADPNADVTTDASKENKYMHAVSSNYKSASFVFNDVYTWEHPLGFWSWNFGTRAEGSNYYLSATNSTELNSVFQTISNSITTTQVTANANAVLRDTLTEQFVLNGNAEDITVQTAAVTGKGTDGKYTWAKSEIVTTGITKGISNDGKTVTVTGFDYTSKDNVITKNGDDYSGHKLIVTIPIKVNQDYNGWEAGTKNYDTNTTENNKAGLTGYTKGTDTNASTLLEQSPQVPVTAYTVTYNWGDNAPSNQTPPTDDRNYIPGQSYTVDSTFINGTKIENASGSYQFSGWTDPNDPNGVMGTNDVTITGSWTHTVPTPPASTYTLTYDANGGEAGPVPTDSTTYTAGQTATLKYDPQPTHAKVNEKNVIFIGWSETNDSGKIYNKGDRIPNLIQSVTMDSNKTVYAVWGLDEDGDGTPDVFEATVTYQIEHGYWFNAETGGSVSTDPVTAQFILYEKNGNQWIAKNPTLGNTIPTGRGGDAGYTADGWYKDSETTATSIGAQTPVTGDVTYTFKYVTKSTEATWDVSRSKTATNLDGNYESKVTLSLPSAEEQLASDVVFVLDKSTSATLEQQALDMLTKLKEQAASTKAKVKVGVVIFNKEANVTQLTDLATGYGTIEAAIKQNISSGTNTHAGLLAGKQMLDSDTEVSANRKYLIFVSDGITYMYNAKPTVTAWSFMADEWKHWAGPDNWNSKYGNNNPPADWSAWMTEIGTQVEAQGTEYEYSYGGTATTWTPKNDTSKNYANSIDKALYLTYQVYQEAQTEGYNCYAVVHGSSTNYLWGPAFMKYLAGDQTVSFDKIQNDILYAVSAGSIVTDTIGEKFTFGGVNSVTLTVGGNKITGTVDGNTVNFGEKSDGKYPYTVTYTPDTKTFVWTINENVSNFAPVQLTYTVKLTKPETAAATYGQTDLDGDTFIDGTQTKVDTGKALYTNQSATLLPVNSAEKPGQPLLFPKPSVSYTVSSGSSGSHSGGSRPSLNTKDHYGYIIGYPVDYYTGQPTTDQTKKPVRPEGKITRAEVATIYFRMLTDESRTKFWSQSNSYSDVKTGDWFNNAVSTLSKAGIIAGYEDGSFKPNGYITRAEFATIAARFFDVTYNGKDLFPDISGHWAKDYINQAANKGFVNGYEDGTFKPDRNITRAEAVTLVNRTLDRHPDKSHFTKDMLVWPDNMDQTKWYYADMQEATNSHTYQMKENSDKTKYENWTKTLPIRNWEALEKAWSNANSSQGNGNVV